jgi:hypothetical protein
MVGLSPSFHAELDGGPLRLRTPTFTGDVACKVEHE